MWNLSLVTKIFPVQVKRKWHPSSRTTFRVVSKRHEILLTLSRLYETTLTLKWKITLQSMWIQQVCTTHCGGADRSIFSHRYRRNIFLWPINIRNCAAQIVETIREEIWSLLHNKHTVISKKTIYKVSIHSFCKLRFPPILAGWWKMCSWETETLWIFFWKWLYSSDCLIIVHRKKVHY